MDREVFLFSNDRTTVGDVRDALAPLGYDVVVKHKLATGIRAIKGHELIILDMPEGIAALREIHSYHPEATVITVSEGKCLPDAIEGGAYDCIEKPLNGDRLGLAVKNALRFLGLRDELGRLKSIEAPGFISDKSIKMHKVVKQIGRVAEKITPVLVSGEKGSGKHIVARMLHFSGPRRMGPFVEVYGSDDLERRLFGSGQASGCILDAEGGTLFLEDIGHLDARTRGRLAKFIKEKKVPPKEGRDPVDVDVRVVCAANGVNKNDPLLKSFAVQIKLPPLRERKEDILPLAEHFLGEAAEAFKVGPKSFSREARQALVSCAWPGNVGELQNTIRKACLISEEAEITSSQLGLDEGANGETVKEFLESKLKRYIKDIDRVRNSGLHGMVMSEVEKALIELIIEETEGNQLRAAGALGINRTTLRNKIKSYKIGRK